MTAESPLIEMRGVTKDHGGARVLRIASFIATESNRVVISGFDDAESETFFHLVSGAAIPDEGIVLVAGADTRTIATDTEWLMSLDRFGFMTHRAVLLESLNVAANLALPMTLEIDPMPPSVLRQVQSLADDVGLDRKSLEQPVGSLDPLSRARLYLGRAIATTPRLLLLEQPTRELTSDHEREAFGQALQHASDHHRVGWVALSDDAVFARASGGRHERVSAETGQITRIRRWWPWN